MRKIKILLVAASITCSGILSSPAFGLTERECVEKTFISQVGVKEATGKNDGIQVEQYLESVGLNKGYAWCGAFVNYCLKECGVDTPKGAAWAPSWFPNDRIIFKNSYLASGRSYITPRSGDVFGIYYYRLKRIGHVGFIHSWDNKNIRTVEGNTSGGGSRDGDGVYMMIRPIYTIHSVATWL